MSMCDNCIHDEVCGVEDNHEEAIIFCANMIPKDILGKIRAELHATAEMHEDENYYLREEWIDEIIDKYIGKSEV